MMFYKQYSDEDIYRFVTQVRKMSIRKDLIRHNWLLIQIYFGFSRHYTRKDLPWLVEWRNRLEKLL